MGGVCLSQRSVTLTLAYLLSAEKMSLIDAFRLVKSKRTIVAPNPAFMRQLGEYEVSLRGGAVSMDLEKYAANRFGKSDSYVLEAYEQSRLR